MYNAIVLILGLLLVSDFALSKYIYRCECKTACSADDIDSKITCGKYKWCCAKADDLVSNRLSTEKPVKKNSILPTEGDVSRVGKDGRVTSKEIPTVDPRLEAAKKSIGHSVTAKSNVDTYTPVENAYKAMNNVWKYTPRTNGGFVEKKHDIHLGRNRNVNMLSARQKYMLKNYNRFKWDSDAVRSPNDHGRALPLPARIIEYPKENAYQLFMQNKYMKNNFGRLGLNPDSAYLDKPALHDFLNGHLSRDPAGFQRYLDLPVDFRRPRNHMDMASRFPPFEPQPNLPFEHLKDFDFHVDRKEYRRHRDPFITISKHSIPHRRFTPDGKEIITITEMPVHIKDDFEEPVHERLEWSQDGERRDRGGGKL